ncbi:MAG: hypothetical protein OXC07_12420 [Kistimonas sp.]|nr:hypothetical protein [Kistimonas sp.]
MAPEPDKLSKALFATFKGTPKALDIKMDLSVNPGVVFSVEALCTALHEAAIRPVSDMNPSVNIPFPLRAVLIVTVWKRAGPQLCYPAGQHRDWLPSFSVSLQAPGSRHTQPVFTPNRGRALHSPAGPGCGREADNHPTQQSRCRSGPASVTSEPGTGKIIRDEHNITNLRQ